MLVRPAAVAMLWSFCAGDPNVISNMQGTVNPEVDSVKEPSVAVVVDAFPETHVAVTAPPLIAAPTAAEPVIGAVAAGTDGSLDPPPPQAAKTAAATTDTPITLIRNFIYLFLVMPAVIAAGIDHYSGRGSNVGKTLILISESPPCGFSLRRCYPK